MKISFGTFEEAKEAEVLFRDLANQARVIQYALCPHIVIDCDYEVGSGGPILRSCADCGTRFPNG